MGDKKYQRHVNKRFFWIVQSIFVIGLVGQLGLTLLIGNHQNDDEHFKQQYDDLVNLVDDLQKSQLNFRSLHNFLVVYSQPSVKCDRLLIDFEHPKLKHEDIEIKKVHLAKMQFNYASNQMVDLESFEKVNFKKTAFGVSSYFECSTKPFVLIVRNKSLHNVEMNATISHLESNQKIIKQKGNSFELRSADIKSSITSALGQISLRLLNFTFLLMMAIAFVLVMLYYLCDIRK
jgi:hypothetical protein